MARSSRRYYERWTSALLLVLLTCSAAPTLESAEEAGKVLAEEEVAEAPSQELKVRAALLEGDLKEARDASERAAKFVELLAIYLEEAALHSEARRVDKAYQTLLEGEAWETMALSAGMRTPVVAAELAKFRSNLLYSDGPGLLMVLRSDAVSATQKYALIALLGAAIEREASLPGWPPSAESPLAELLADVRGELEEVWKERKERDELAKSQQGKEREVTMLFLLETYTQEADILRKAGLPVRACRILLEGYERESREGLAGSERSVVSYSLGRFFESLRARGQDLLAILHAAEVPVEKKQGILFNLRDAVRRGDFPPPDWRGR